MAKTEFSEALVRLLWEPGDAEALDRALASLETTVSLDDALKALEGLPDDQEGAAHRYLLCEVLHRSGRFDEADTALREARRGAAERRAFDAMAKRHLPRAVERARFYRCQKAFGFEGKDVLELGGQLPHRFVAAAEPASWTCLDLRADEVDEPGYRRLRGDAARMPLGDESADFVFSSSAFEHVSDLPATLSEIARVLRPGGRLFSDFGPIWSSADGHHLRGVARQTLRAAEAWPLAPWAHLTLTRKQMRTFLAERLDAEQKRTVERWLYRRPTLNRLFFEDYVHYFHNCPLRVERLDFKTGPEPDDKTRRLLERRQPGRTNFHVKGFRAVLRK